MVNVSVIIHGVPLGHEIVSSNNNNVEYFKYYYGAKHDNHSMIVKTIVLDNIIQCEYTYYVNDINSNAGRPGAYFAISLISNYFIPDLSTIYNILSMTYRQKVIGNIINNENTQFLVSTLAPKGKEIHDYIQNALSILIKRAIPLDDTFIANSNPTITVHPSCLDTIELISTYKKVEMLIVSPSAQTDKERKTLQECQNKINYIRNDAESKIKKIQQESSFRIQKERQNSEELHMKEKELNDSYIKLQNIEKFNQQLQQERQLLQEKLKQEVMRCKEYESKMNSMAQANLQQKNKLEELAKILKDVNVSKPIRKSGSQWEKPEPLDMSYKRVNQRRLKIIGVTQIILNILLIGLVTGLYFRNNTNKNEAPLENIVSRIQDDMTSDKESAVGDFSSDINQSEPKTEYGLIKDVRIDIKNLRAPGLLEPGEVYSLNVRGFEMPQDVAWEIKGEYELISKDAFRVLGGTSVTLQCLYQNKIISERTVNVRQKEVDSTNDFSTSQKRKKGNA